MDRWHVMWIDPRREFQEEQTKALELIEGVLRLLTQKYVFKGDHEWLFESNAEPECQFVKLQVNAEAWAPNFIATELNLG